jgi:hypothetical protein
LNKEKLFMNRKSYIIAILLALAPVSISAQIAGGGAFTLEKSIVANGGGASSSGSFSVTATGGQSAAGTPAANAPFSQTAGFWTGETLAPTAALVSIGGNVLTADGRGIKNVMVTLTDSSGESRSVLTGSFGYYRFTDVQVGEIYVLTVQAKKYIFAYPSKVVSVQEELTSLDFIADGI